MAGTDIDVDKPSDVQPLVEAAEASSQSPQKKSDRKSRLAIWLERVIYGTLSASVITGVIGYVTIDDLGQCDTRIANALTDTGLALAISGLFAYLSRLMLPNRRRWFHLAFVLLIVIALLELFLFAIWVLGVDLSESC
jgi:hypothetical protein